MRLIKSCRYENDDWMGSVLLGIVARRRSDKGVKSDKLELGECVYKSKEIHLLETPPLGIRNSSASLKPDLKKNALKIGKLARLGERKVGDEKQQVNLKVSHVIVAYLEQEFVETSDSLSRWLIAHSWKTAAECFSRIKGDKSRAGRVSNHTTTSSKRYCHRGVLSMTKENE